MEDFVRRIQERLSVGSYDEAVALVKAEETRDPAKHALGAAILAITRNDVAAAIDLAGRAAALSDDPLVHEHLAVAHLMRGDQAAAEAPARRGVERGGGKRALGGLGNILLGLGKFGEAEETFQKLVDLDPSDAAAHNGLASARYRQGNVTGASLSLAHAWDANPNDSQPIRNLVSMFGDAGRMLGAYAYANLVREKQPLPEQLAIALDLLGLQLTTALQRDLQDPRMLADGDLTARRLVANVRKRPPRAQLGAARALVDVGRLDEAKQLVAALEKQPLDETDRANRLYVMGMVAAAEKDMGRALEAYALSVETDGTRWDACCNAISLLLESADEQSMTRIGKLVARVPIGLKRTTPPLLINEAIWMSRTGRKDEARKNLEGVLVLTRGEGQLAQLARQIIAGL